MANGISSDRTLHSIQELRRGDHLCYFYETEDEHKTLVTQYIRQGFERNEKVIYIVDIHTAGTILDYLRNDGLDVESCITSGQFTVFSASDIYLCGGVFDPDRMIDLLKSETGRALSEGFTALKATGEMTWALKGLPGSERLIEYEAKLNTFLTENKCMALCQYDKKCFDAEFLLDVLNTHPIAMIGNEVFNNFYYLPPEEFLEADSAARRLRHRIKNLKERKQLEERLHFERTLLDTLLNNTLDLIYFKDKEVRFVRLSKSSGELLNISPEEAIGKNDRDFFVEELAEEKFKDDCSIMQSGEPVVGEEEEVALKNGKRLWVSTTKLPWFNENGEVIGLFGISRDITERKLQEKALRESEERFRSLVNSMTDAIYVLNTEQRFTEIFGKWIEKYGIIPKNVLGKTPREYFGAEQSPIHEEANARALAGERVVYEWSIDWSGKTIYAQSSLSPIRNAQGEIVGLVGVGRNITKLKNMEQLLIQSEKMTAIGTLAAGIAHEINNPIGYIHSNLKTLEKYNNKFKEFYNSIKILIEEHLRIKPDENDGLSEGFHKIINTIGIDYVIDDMGNAIMESLEGTDKVKKIVLDMREFSHPKKYEMRLANINEGIEKTLNLIWSELKYKATIIKELGTFPEIECDIQKISQVVMNILINAAHAIEKSGTIEIKTFGAKNSVIIQISDSGKGISKENIEKIFDAFYTTKDPGKGTGLGLSISHRIIQEHNGTIHVESELGKGTTFTIQLPILHTQLLREQKILIVDDDSSLRKLIKKLIFNYDPSIFVKIAKDGFEAAELLLSFEPEVVLLDIMMPGIDGFEVCKKITSEKRKNNPRVVMMTGYSSEDFKKKSFEAGAVEFLSKPITIEKLKYTLDKIYVH